MWEVCMFELGLLVVIQQRIKDVQQQFQHEMDTDTLQEEFQKFEDQVMDLGNNVVYLNNYEWKIALYWVMKNIIGHAMWERLEQNDGEEPTNQWRKVMQDESKEFHLKMDSILQSLGIRYP